MGTQSTWGTNTRKMSSSTVTVTPRKLMKNCLLNRRQMILDIKHPNLPTPDKALLRKLICEHLSKSKSHAKADPSSTVVFGMKTNYGGGASTGFCLVYDSQDAAKKIEPKHRLIKIGLTEAVTRTHASSARRRRTARRSSVAHARRSVSASARSKRSISDRCTFRLCAPCAGLVLAQVSCTFEQLAHI